MAVPGETTCREVAPCGSGRWGTIPVEPSTQYVDGAYAGLDSDGTAERPWTTIQAAVEAADESAIVAIAAGQYAELVDINGKPVRLWGVCPAKVEIVGDADNPAVVVRNGADGAELHDVAITGAHLGVGILNALDVHIDRLWIHDTGSMGLDVEASLSSSADVSGSLIESAHEVGVFSWASELTLESCVVRRTQLEPSGFGGYGIQARQDPSTGEAATLSITRSLVAENRQMGILVLGSTLTADGVAVMDTEPRADGGLGRGISVFWEEITTTPSSATIRQVVLARNREVGLMVGASDVSIERTTVRDTLPEVSTGQGGRGIGIEGSPNGLVRSTGAIRESLIERAGGVGMFAAAADAIVESTIVRGGAEAPGGSAPGRGVEARHLSSAAPTTLTIRGDVIEGNADIGILLGGVHAEIDETLVRGTRPNLTSGWFGRGIQIQDFDGRVSTATVRRTRVEESYDLGVGIMDASVTIEATTIAATHPRASNGSFGDGLVVESFEGSRSEAIVRDSRIERSARAGVANFGGRIVVGQAVLECNPIYMNGETVNGFDFAFEDQGDNVCGCDGAPRACQVLSSMLTPPEAVDVGPEG